MPPGLTIFAQAEMIEPGLAHVRAFPCKSHDRNFPVVFGQIFGTDLLVMRINTGFKSVQIGNIDQVFTQVDAQRISAPV